MFNWLWLIKAWIFYFFIILFFLLVSEVECKPQTFLRILILTHCPAEWLPQFTFQLAVHEGGSFPQNPYCHWTLASLGFILFRL